MSEQRPTPRADMVWDENNGETSDTAAQRIYDLACTLELELAEALEALTQIHINTNADDPESYRADDREGCLDAVFAIADKVLHKPKGESK